MQMKLRKKFGLMSAGAGLVAAFIAGYVVGEYGPGTGEGLVSEADAAQSSSPAAGGTLEWSRTKPYPRHNVYYPGTEELAPDEMRVIISDEEAPKPEFGSTSEPRYTSIPLKNLNSFRLTTTISCP